MYHDVLTEVKGKNSAYTHLAVPMNLLPKDDGISRLEDERDIGLEFLITNRCSMEGA